MNDHGELISFVETNRLWSRAEIVADPCPIPRSPGVYAWFFREIPPQVPTVDCVQRDGLTLLYVGISPKKPTPGKRPSKETFASGRGRRLALRCHDHRDHRMSLCVRASTWMSDKPFYAPDRGPLPSRQPAPGEEVWRLPHGDRVQSCELRNAERADAGWDVLVRENGELLFSR